MEFRVNFPLSFHIISYSEYLFKKSEYERNIIKNQYHNCCNISKETINIIVIN